MGAAISESAFFYELSSAPTRNHQDMKETSSLIWCSGYSGSTMPQPLHFPLTYLSISSYPLTQSSLRSHLTTTLPLSLSRSLSHSLSLSHTHTHTLSLSRFLRILNPRFLCFLSNVLSSVASIITESNKTLSRKLKD